MSQSEALALAKNTWKTINLVNLEKYIEDADEVICGPMPANEKDRLAFVWKDGAILELYEEN